MIVGFEVQKLRQVSIQGESSQFGLKKKKIHLKYFRFFVKI